MRFTETGPDVPDELIKKQEEGKTIFICGAGVSMPDLPSFRGLVEHVYSSLNEDWASHPAEREGMTEGGELYSQYDRVLRCLEKRFGTEVMKRKIRDIISERLACPDDADLQKHCALLKLSRDKEGQTRLVTTNFDTLFEHAWDGASHIQSFAGSAMPQPNSTGYVGVLHLHGRLSDEGFNRSLTETQLVLTSPEFGDAYLRSGWASRYIYDLVRAYTVVLVGYTANDPPMRYLLEVLEADRERYPDLQKIYAFADSKPGEEAKTLGLWRAKGVEPILYTKANGDHSCLYASIQEWSRYAENPSAWRRSQLAPLLKRSPSELSEDERSKCFWLLGHNDASQILAELSPDAAWLKILLSNGLMGEEKIRPGRWIAAHLNSPHMIRACTNIHSFDNESRWYIQNALRDSTGLSPMRRNAWKMLLSAKRRKVREDGFDERWFNLQKDIEKDNTDGFVCKEVADIFRPKLVISSPYFLEDSDAGEEKLYHLVHLSFEGPTHPTVDDILKIWPADPQSEEELFRSLTRSLVDALEEARTVGVISSPFWGDGTNNDVPSVAHHPQNEYHSSFCPIVRLIAEMWGRIAAKNPDKAKNLVLGFEDSDFILIKRLSLYALNNRVYAPTDAVRVTGGLNGKIFWASSIQVELMRLLCSRWNELPEQERAKLENRIIEGPSREDYPKGFFEDENDWMIFRTSSIFKRLSRIKNANGLLTEISAKFFEQVKKDFSDWQASAGDRDDFSVWSEGGTIGNAHPELLDATSEDALVPEALRIQKEQFLTEGNLWRDICKANPSRALKGLIKQKTENETSSNAWREFIWAIGGLNDLEIQKSTACELRKLDVAIISEITPAISDWLRKMRRTFLGVDEGQGLSFFELWDWLAGIAFNGGVRISEEKLMIDDQLSQALNEPGGILAWMLIDDMGEQKFKLESLIPEKYKKRLQLIVSSENSAGFYGRVYLAHVLAYLHAVDAAAAMHWFLPLLAISNKESYGLWKAFSTGRIPYPSLFNALKLDMLAFLDKSRNDDEAQELLVGWLFWIETQRKQGKCSDYDISPQEIKRLLSEAATSVREKMSWLIWNYMHTSHDFLPENKEKKWQCVVGPMLSDVWPLDAAFRGSRVSGNFVRAALECDGAFPEAVNAILPFLIPYQHYLLQYTFRLEREHGALIRKYPQSALHLANAIIGTKEIPNDLGEFLEELKKEAPMVEQDPAFIRLSNLWKLRAA